MSLRAFRALHAEGLGVVDVGCRGGLHPMFKEVAPLLEVIGFEPDPEEGDRLQPASKSGWEFRSLKYLTCALSAHDGQGMLHVCRSRGASSCYQPNRAFLDRFPDAERFDVVTSVPVPVRSLDSLTADPAMRLPTYLDFLKIDTQGAELDILQGAKRVLEHRLVAVEVEVEFAQLYVSQPVFRDVDAFLAACGFRLFKLRRQEWVRTHYARWPHRTAGQLVFGDALYLKDPLDRNGASWIPHDARQAEALILLAVLYGLHDFAMELLTTPQVSSLLHDVEGIRQYVIWRSHKLGSFIERLRMVRAALSASERFRRYPKRWARGDVNFYSTL